MSNLIRSFSDDFNVTWDDPVHATESWLLDPVNFPSPMPPLTQALHERIIAVAFGLPTVFVNGYAFMKDFAPPPPAPEVEARGPNDVWQNDFLAKVKEACARIRGRDYDSLPAGELARVLPAAFDQAAAAFRYTTIVIFAFFRPTAALIDFCESELGEDASGLAVCLLQGFANETSAAGYGLSELAEQAGRLPAVAEALRAERHADLASVAGGAEFLECLHRFLDEYGGRAESWGTPHLPTWAEDPSLPLSLIGRYLREPERSPAVSLRRSAAERATAIREVESRLGGEKLARFRGLLAAAEAHVGISEERAHWQLLLVGGVRLPALALGRKLAAAGVLEAPNDVFYLSKPELTAAASGRGPSKELIAQRKADLARQETLTPPPYLGVPPSPSRAPADLAIVMRYLRGYGVAPSSEANVINGLGASRGVARGRARIIRDLGEAGRLGAGDILVCRTTSPPWTSLFTVAGGVVTDAGGILSHSAICAREYGIPCVVGTQVATTCIPEGAYVTVDGAKGTVTIEG